VVPMWFHLIRTISSFLPLVEEVNPSNPIAGLDPHLTHRLEENLVFNALTLNIPFLFCMHNLQSSEFLNSRRSLKSLHVALTFGPFNLPLTLHSEPPESQSPRLLKGPPPHVVTY
jgi:hypothetical protein